MIKFRDDYMLVENDNKIIFLPASTESIKKEKIFSTNSIGGVIIKLIMENNDIFQIHDYIVEKYDVDKKVAEIDVNNFLKKLVEEGIIEVE